MNLPQFDLNEATHIWCEFCHDCTALLRMDLPVLEEHWLAQTLHCNSCKLEIATVYLEKK